MEETTQAATLDFGPRRVLLVVEGFPLRPADEAIRQRLQSKGFVLSVRPAREVQASEADGFAAAVVSESVLSTEVGSRICDLPIGTVLLEPSLFDDCGLTGTRWWADFGDYGEARRLEVAAISHPLAAGLSGEVTVTTAPEKMVWGRPSSSAVVAARISKTDLPAVFGYESGDGMVSGVARARRVGFFAGRDLARSFTGEGWRLFDAAIEWAAVPRAALVVGSLPLSPSDTVLLERLQAAQLLPRTLLARDVQPVHVAGMAVVLISESALSTDVGVRLRDVAVPVVSAEPSLFDDFGMTGPAWGSDYGDILGQTKLRIAARDPIAAGLTLRAEVAVTTTPQKLVWGVPGPQAVVAATIADTNNRAAIFSYDRGAQMVGLRAPARRVGWFAGADTAAALTGEGRALLDAALRWASSGAGFAESCAGRPDGTLCDDEDPCNGIARCFAGRCRQLPSAPAAACSVAPLLTCTAPLPGGGVRAVFGYKNERGTNAQQEPDARLNALSPPQPGVAPPTWFKAGPSTQPVAFTANLAAGQSVTWRLGNRSVTATAGSTQTPTCQVRQGQLGPEVVVDGQPVRLAIEPEVALADTVTASMNPDGRGAIGKVDGALTVTDSGSAMYRIPIWAPPGMGPEPQVELVCDSSSNSGHGFAGVGWAVSGVSEIRRCPRNKLQDGQPDPIRFTRSDAYCWDGRRLVVIADRGDTIEFRTEVDTFAKIIAKSVGEFGPTSFEISAQDGRKLTFGTTPASRFSGRVRLSEGGSVERILAWGVDRVEDRFGSYMAVDYFNEVSPGGLHQEWLPSAIRYGGNTKTGRLPDRRLVFRYDGRLELGTGVGANKDLRPDPTIRYVAGFRIDSSRLLGGVELHGPNEKGQDTTLRTYKLFYRATSLVSTDLPTVGTERTLLTSITTCDGSGVCVPRTTFDYTTNDNVFELLDTDVDDVVPAGVEHYWTLQTGDFDGDGRDDILYRSLRQRTPELAEDWRVRFSTGYGFGPPIDVSDRNDPDAPDTRVIAKLPNRGFHAKNNLPIVLDFDMDGRSDVAVAAGGVPPHWRVFRGVNRSNVFSWIEKDANGDGFINEHENLETLGAYPPPKATDINAAMPLPLYVGDFDGDGLPDLMQPRYRPNVETISGWWAVRRNLGTLDLPYATLSAAEARGPFARIGEQRAPSAWSAYTLDLDGDGAVELMYAPYDPGSDFVPRGASYLGASLRKDGTARVVGVPQQALGPGDSRILHADLNADGLSDLFVLQSLGGWPEMYLNTGNDLQLVAPLTPASGSTRDDWFAPNREGPLGVVRDSGHRLADYDGDGLPDFVFLDVVKNATMDRDELVVVLARPGPRTCDDKGVDNSLVACQYTYRTVKPWYVVNVDGQPRLRHIPLGLPSGSTRSDSRGGPSHIGARVSQMLDIDGDGLQDIAQINARTRKLEVYRRRGHPPDRLFRVTDGYGRVDTLEYKPISDTSVYAGPGNRTLAYPYQFSRRGLWVVSKHQADDGLDAGTFTTFLHRYSLGVTDVSGEGWLGFQEHIVTNAESGVERKLEYALFDTYRGRNFRRNAPFKITTRYPLKRGERTRIQTFRMNAVPSPEVGDDAVVFALRHQGETDVIRERNADLPGGEAQISFKSYAWEFGDYFNETYRRVDLVAKESADENVPPDALETLETWTTYLPPDKERWLVSKPRLTRTRSKMPDGRERTRVVEHKVDPGTGVLTGELREPEGAPDERQETTLVRNEEGQVTSISVAGAGEARTTTFAYDRSGVFPRTTINAEGHTQETYFHPGYGVLGLTVDENGLIARLQYDGFLNPKRIDRPDAADTRISYSRVLGDASAAYVIDEDTVGHTWTRTTYDRLSRPTKVEVRRRKSASETAWAVSRIGYDELGRVSAVLRPRFEGERPSGVLFAYDSLGRLTNHHELVETGWVTTTFEHAGLESTMIDPEAHKIRTKLDYAGRVDERVEVNARDGDRTASFKYAPFFQLEQVTLNGTPDIKFEYDVLGRRIAEHSPNTGTTKLVYDAFDQVHSTTDANGVELEREYDRLGRLLFETDVRSGAVSQYVWDSALNGIGAPGSATSTEGSVVTYGYDQLSRPVEEVREVRGETFSVSRVYDSFGQLTSMTYPAVRGRRLMIGYEYDSVTGELESVKRGNAVLWRVEERDAQGRARKELLGGSMESRTDFYLRGLVKNIKTALTTGEPLVVQDLVFDYWPDGRLSSREDRVGTRDRETFEYDEQGRLSTWWFGGRERGAGYAYDRRGNLTARATVGSWSLPSVAFSFTGGASGGPDAVKSTSLGETFAYDAKGNQLGGGARKLVEYTPFDLPARIETKDGSSATFEYDAFQARVWKASGEAKTTYFPELYERRIEPGQNAKHVFHVIAERPVAEIVWEVTGTGEFSSDRTFFLHPDHLGSTEAVTDELGQVVERLKFDPFGRRMSPDDFAGRKPRTSDTSRGFTGHELEEDLGLINMRGRVYDPAQMRFVSADPIREILSGPARQNPYAYVHNDPLNLVDPSGFLANPSTAAPNADYPASPYDVWVFAPRPSQGQTQSAGTSDDSGTQGGRIVYNQPVFEPHGCGAAYTCVDGFQRWGRTRFGLASVSQPPQSSNASVQDQGGSVSGGPLVSAETGQPIVLAMGTYCGPGLGDCKSINKSISDAHPALKWTAFALGAAPFIVAGGVAVIEALGLGAAATSAGSGALVLPRLVDHLVKATSTIGPNGLKMLEAGRQLSVNAALTAKDKAQAMLMFFNRIGFATSSSGLTDKGQYLEMFSEDMKYSFRFMVDSGKILYGKFSLEAGRFGDYVWRELQ